MRVVPPSGVNQRVMGSKLSSNAPRAPHPAKNPRPSGLGFFSVELRGFEPLTPTLPGTGTSPEQPVCGHFRPVAGVAEAATVVTVVVKIVVGFGQF